MGCHWRHLMGCHGCHLMGGTGMRAWDPPGELTLDAERAHRDGDGLSRKFDSISSHVNAEIASRLPRQAGQWETSFLPSGIAGCMVRAHDTRTAGRCHSQGVLSAAS